MMTSDPEPTRQVEDLRRMIQELGSPDLTLARSGELRSRIVGLLEDLRPGTAAQPARR